MAARGFLAPGDIDYFFALSSPPLSLEVGALEVGPLKTSQGPGERCKLPSGVLGEAPAANDFYTFRGPRNVTDDI